MTDVVIESGIRGPVYLHGKNLTIGPDKLDDKWDEVATYRRKQSGRIVQWRPASHTNGPMVRRYYTCAIEWPAVGSADYVHLERLCSMLGPFDFVPGWLWIVERFEGSGSRSIFSTRRRVALNVLSSGFIPDGAATDFPTTMWVNGTVKTVTTDYTIGTADPDGRTPFTLTTPITGDWYVEIGYAPLFYMVRQDDQLARGADGTFASRRALSLLEAN